LAELAGSLPGDTQQYIQVSRQISDGIYQVLANDKEGSLALAQKIAEQNGRVLNLDSMNAAQQVQAAGKELVGEMTKLTVLGSLGQRQGAMGLPQLIEQMMSQEQVSSGQFKRYAAIFRDPLVKSALERNIPKINAAAKNTGERLEALKNTLDEVVTPDLVRRYQRSTAGVIEEMKTLFLNPEVGMLGLGRPLATMAVSFNEFGQMIDENKNVVTDVANAAREQISIFDYVRDIFANLAIVLGPIIKVATTLFMGFEDLAEVLSNAREFTMKLQSNFERYRVGLEEVAKSLEGDAKTNFTSTISIRSALATVNNMLANFGVYGEEEFQKIGTQLKSPDFSDFPNMVMGLLDTFLKSDVAIKLGNSIGEVLGTVLKAFSDTLLGVTDAAGVENLFSGFMKGFEGAGGIEAANAILNKIVDILGKAFMFMATNFPVKTFVAALILLAPALISGFVAALPGLIALIGPPIAAWFSGTGFAATIAGWLGGIGPALAGIGTFISATLLPALGTAFTAIGTFITGTILPALGTAFAAIGTFVTAILAPVLAVAGAIMGLVAIFRHLDFIVSSFGHGLVALGLMIETGFLTIIGNILKFVGNIPGMGGLKNKGQAMLDKAEKNKVKSSERVEKINENTAASLERTASDFEKMGNLFKGRGFTSNQEAGVAPGGPGVQANSFDGALAHLNAFTSSIGNFFTKTIPDAWNAGMEAVGNFFTKTFPDAWNAGIKAVGNFFTKTFPDAWNAGMKAIGNFIQSAVDGLVNMVKNTWNGLVNFIKELPYTIGYAIGFTIQSIQNAWNGLVDFFTVTLPTAWSTAVSATIGFLTNAWQGLVNFFTVTIPAAWNTAVSATIGFLTNAWQGLVNFFTVTLPTAVSTMVNAVKGAFQLFIDWIAGLAAAIGEKITTFLTFAATIPGKITGFLFDVATAIIDWAKGLPGRIMSSLTGGFIAGQQAASSHNGNTSHTMGLGAAIATENANKPAGSHLVIANSSETVIPAYKGHMAESAFDGMVARSAYSGMGGGGGDVNLGGITVNVSGVNNPTDIANQVAEELLQAIKKSTYTELYST
jgi:hypothetical protein